MKKEKLVYAIATLFFLSSKMFAQDTLKNKQLSEVVVSASRSEKNVEDVGRSITVITGADIKSSGVNSFQELLSQQLGMYVVGTGQNPGMNGSLFLRGSNSNHTVILIDGIPITDPSAINNAIDLSEISLSNIEKVEIVRGSQSTLFGSSAIGGVINIITKKANKPGLSADVSIVVGTFGKNLSEPSYESGDRKQTGKATTDLSENLYLNYGFKNGIYIGADLANQNVKGFDATLDTVTNNSVFKHKNLSDGFDKIDWIGKAGYRSDKMQVYASFKQVHQKTDIDKGAYRDDDNYTLDFKRNLFNYGASYKMGEKINLAFTGGMTQMERIAIDDSSVIDNAGTFDQTYSHAKYQGSSNTNELQGNYRIKGFNLVLGGGVYSDKMKINTFYLSPFYKDTTSLDSLAPKSLTSNFFLHSDLGSELFNDRLKWLALSAGIRLSNHSLFGTNLTYELNPSVKTGPGGLLFASYSTGFNAPSLYQLYDVTRYYTWDTQTTNGVTLGNKNLKPETSKTFEIGFKQSIGNISFAASYFNTEVNDVIEYVYLWNKNVAIDSLAFSFSDEHRAEKYLNLGTLLTQGVELSVSSWLSDKVQVSANIALTSGKLKYNASTVDTSETHGDHIQIFANGEFLTSEKEVQTIGLTRRPSTANLAFTYFPIKKIAIRTDIRYVGARSDVYYDSALGPWGALNTVFIEQYTLVDLSLLATIYKGLSASIKVKNLLDKKYSEINGFTTRGRGLYFTLRFSL